MNLRLLKRKLVLASLLKCQTFEISQVNRFASQTNVFSELNIHSLLCKNAVIYFLQILRITHIADYFIYELLVTNDDTTHALLNRLK